MPQVTVYIRSEDYQQWKDIQQKSEFIHNALNGSSSNGSASTVGTTRTVAFEAINSGSSPEHPAKLGKVGDVTGVVVDKTIQLTDFLMPAPRFTGSVKMCKVHNIPLNKYDKCLQKGCKYS